MSTWYNLTTNEKYCNSKMSSPLSLHCARNSEELKAPVGLHIDHSIVSSWMVPRGPSEGTGWPRQLGSLEGHGGAGLTA